MIAFIMDDEPACAEIVKTHFHEKNVVEASQSFHCLAASVGIHATTSAEGVCGQFGCNTCSSHQRISMRAQAVYIQSTRVSAPQFLFLRSDGETVLLRHVWELAPSELLKKMKLALMFSDPSKADEAAKHASAEVTEAMETIRTSKDPYKRSMALQKLASLDDPRIMDFLIKQTTDENVETPRRLEAIGAMGARGNAKALPALIKTLKSALPGIRNRSAIAIETLAMLDAGDALVAAFKTEQNEGIKGNLLRALAVCDSTTPEHVKLIMSMIDGGPARVRGAAIRASFDLVMSADLKKSLLAAAKHTAPGVRAAAFCALAHHQIKEAIPIIEAALPHELVPEIKKAAQGSLAILKAEPDYEGPTAADLLARIVTR
jgi:HEAT repeat protein